MLEALDRLVAVSSSHFRAAEAGQLSLFGAHTGVTESVTLPLVPDADRRETLNWERELIGMYMGEHPLTPYMNEIRRVVSSFLQQPGRGRPRRESPVAGMVTGIRPHQTKTGKMMAWVTLEDLTGTIELVVFPRTWEKFQFALEVGGVILAEGKVDAQSNPSKVLVDNIRTEIKLTEPAQKLAPLRDGKAPRRWFCSRSAACLSGSRLTRPRNALLKGLPLPTGSLHSAACSTIGAKPDRRHPKTRRIGKMTSLRDAAFAVHDLVVHAADLPEEEPAAPAAGRESSDRLARPDGDAVPRSQPVAACGGPDAETARCQPALPGWRRTTRPRC